MRYTAPSRVNAQTSDLPIARLDAQDIEQSLPLRDYLEQNGCAVVVNRKPAIGEAYHIICGDEDFVEETIEEVFQKNSKPLVVLLMGKKRTVHESLRRKKAKIAAVSGSSIPTRDIPTIFAYFFTSDDDLLYLDQGSSPMVKLKPLTLEPKDISPIVEESLVPDADRVSRVRGVSLLIMSIVAAPVVWYLVSLAMVAAVQWYGVSALSRGDVSRTSAVAGITTYWLGQGKGALTLVGVPAKLFGAGEIIRSQERALSVIGDIANAQEKAAELIAQSNTFAPMLLTGSNERNAEEPSFPVMIDRMRLAIDGLTNSLGLAGAQLHLMAAERHFPFTFPYIRSIVERLEAEIVSVITHTGAIRNLLALYRTAGGFDEKKTYLMLLQNSMELRPTGGFIGSIATVAVEDGAIETPVVADVYALDGQLKGHVDPPLPIKELLQQEHWYLRDSNWDPDFRASGEKAAWFYEKETGITVDGVIAIATPFLTDLLGVTGPLDLSDYNDRITKENFFGKSLFYTKADFFPGSTQKKDFLGSLMVTLLARFTSGTSAGASGLLQVLSQALTRGDIQFWFPDREVQAVAQQAGWTGELTRPVPCQTLSPACMADRIALVEANLGVNKVNSYIKRSVKTRVDLGEDGAVDGAIVITYHNTSTDDTTLSGGGVYLVYLRVFVPPDALIVSAALDEVEIPGKAVKFSERTTPYRDADEITDGSTVAGVAFTVPPGMERAVTITYRRGIPLTFTDNESTFVFSIRKQPGITDTPIDVAIGYPAGWRSNGATETFANMREVRYNTTLDKNKTFTVRFKKK